MSATTGIEWTDATWNPVVGCTKVTQGCKHCYAKTIHDMRHKAHLAGKKVAPQYAQPFETVQLKPERLTAPLRWREPRRVFVNSVSDLFHEDVPDAFIFDVWSTMAQAERHTFQILTKRPARMLQWFNEYVPDACSGEQPAPVWPLPNVWLGVSVENQAAADERIPLLAETPAAIRFLSCEPLLEALQLDFEDISLRSWDGRTIDWVIVGGESGKGARPMDIEWAYSIAAQCKSAGVAAFVKQLGDVPMEPEHVWRGRAMTRLLSAKNHDRVPDGFVPLQMGKKGSDMSAWPEELRVREFPTSEVCA